MSITIIESLKQVQDDMIQTTRKLCDINSGSYNSEGLANVADELKILFSTLFTDIKEVPLKPIQRVTASGKIEEIELRPSLVFKRNPEAPMQLLMTGHYDTVFPVTSSFQSTWIEGEYLRGPGVADMKGGLVMLKHALDYTFSQPYGEKVGVTLIISPDEEIGSPSSAELLVELAKTADFGLTYEPALADGTLAGARKGSGNFSIVVKGKSAHAGREFFNGRNAMIAAAEVSLKLAQLSDQETGITVNVAAIDGGGPPNVVPDTAVIRFNIRIEQPAQMSILNEINSIIDSVASNSGCDIELHGTFNRPPKPMTERQQWMFELLKDVGQDLGLAIAWKPTGGCCEGNNLAAAGLINIDTLGVRGGAIHSEDEFAVLDSFAERAALSAALIKRLLDITLEGEHSC
ncbi:MAG: hydrolase [Gammaproteobacteria bacterium]|nr:hydrolase [Gammaproteobacteria bacterium]